MTCIKTAKKPSYLNTSIPEVGKRAAKTENPSDLDRFSRMQDELEALRNEITKKNRDQLDMMYNLDMDNFSDDMKALFKQWSDGSNDAKTYFETYINSNEAKWQAYSEWKTATSASISTIEGRVTSNESSIHLISQWKADTADGAISSIAAIQQQADSNGARIGLLVKSDGTGLTPSAAGIIVDAVNGSGSSVMISADKIQFSGEASFVTAGSLGDSGSTVVSGNRIKLHMLYGTSTATSKLNFTASDTASDTWYDTLATIGLKNYGSDSADDAKYALLIDSQLANENGKEYNVALKLSAKGSISIESATPDGGIYISTNGFTTIEAYENVRIRASASMANMGQTGLMAFSNKDYVFCTDGIYYNGKRIVDNTQGV